MEVEVFDLTDYNRQSSISDLEDMKLALTYVEDSRNYLSCCGWEMLLNGLDRTCSKCHYKGDIPGLICDFYMFIPVLI